MIASKVCPACQNMFQAWHDRATGIFSSHEGHHHVPALQRGAATGCHLCTLLLGELEILGYHFAITDATRITVCFWRKRAGLSEGSDTLTLRLSEGHDGQPSQHTDPLLIRKLTDIEITDIPPLPNTTDSKENWALSRSWFEKCLKSHKVCSSRTSPRLPTRLVRVGSTHRDAQLCLSKDLPKETQYATLSHCWGTLSITRLQTDNVEALQQALPFDKLCKTFQESFVAAHRFGLEYIWIDSLCIIQDDEDDWRQESGLMGEVYGNSTLNIAATAAPDGRSGLFPSRSPLPLQNCQIKVRSDQIGNESAVTYELTRTGIYERCVIASPLGRRAWTLQERFLASRTLHFGKELLWEFQEEILSETFPDRMSEVHCGLASVVLKKREINSHLGETIELLRSFWDAVIEVYTSTALSKPADKLVALSGIARWTHDRLGTTYVCGLWKELLQHQLLWRATGSYPWPKNAAYRAPSWSWAAVEGPCLLDKSLWPVPSTIRVVEAHIFNTNSDSYGQVLNGYIRLTCTELFAWPMKNLDIGHQYEDSGISFWPDRDPELCSFDKPSESCFCLSFYDPSLTGGIMLGLVLEGTPQRGQFRRVGLFEIEGTEVTETFHRARSKIADESMYEELAGFDRKGRRKYVISII